MMPSCIGLRNKWNKLYKFHLKNDIFSLSLSLSLSSQQRILFSVVISGMDKLFSSR